jgi:hypothetical protein
MTKWEAAALKRRVRILELKLVIARALNVLDNSGDHKATVEAGRAEHAATNALRRMKLTPEEEAL